MKSQDNKRNRHLLIFTLVYFSIGYEIEIVLKSELI